MRDRPLAVAITGGIGAGKTEALKAFGRHGAATLSSDEVVHRLFREQDVKRAVVERLGPGVLGEGGEVDRARVAAIVFADPDALAWLESLLHPLVVQEHERWRDGLSRLQEPPTLCVTEVPLLYETGGEARFDAVVVITAPPAVRDARSPMARPERERRLLADDEKVRRADFAYVNDGSLAELDDFVASVVAELDRRRG